jgi:RHS repeat-associated protein
MEIAVDMAFSAQWTWLGRCSGLAKRTIIAGLLSLTAAYAQGIVDPRSGRLLLSHTDLVLPAGAVALEVERTLAAKPSKLGRLGGRWRLNWESSLARVDSLVMVEEAGVTTYFQQEGDIFRSPSGDRVVFEQKGYAFRTRRDGTLDTFDPLGRLVRRDLGNGNIITVRWSPSNRLARIEGPKGTWLRLTVRKDGRMETIEASSGAKVQYTYAGDALVAVAVNGGPALRYGYDANGALIRLEDPVSGAVEFSYDSKGRVASRRWGDGSQERHEYDDSTGSYRHIDAAGGVTSIQRLQDGRREEITDPLGHRTVVEYDDSGLPVAITGPTGVSVRFTYDALARVVVSQGGRGEMTRFEYLGQTRMLKAVTRPDGSRRTLDYDANSNLTAIREGAETVLSLTYYPDGLVRSASGPRMPARTFSYDPGGRLISETDALGKTTRYEYDPRGNLLRRTNALGGVDQWSYDAQNRLLSTTDPAGGLTQFGYNAVGRLLSETDPDGGAMRYQYDARGRLAAQTDLAGRTTRYQYDAAGRLAAITDPAGNSHRFQYDAAGNQVRAINPLGGATSFAFDALGNVTSEADPAGASWRYEYSPSGELARVMEPTGASVQHHYDAQGRRTGLTDAAGGSIRFQHDGQGRLTSLQLPDGTARTYAYDAAGNLLTDSETTGAQNRYEYDALQRLLRVRTASGLETSYQHDALGNLLGWQDNLGRSSAMRYDPAGRLLGDTGPTGASIRYRYDLAGRLLEATDPLGQATRTGYTAAHEVAQVTEPSGDLAAYKYDPAGRLSEIRHPSGAATRLAYDAMGNLAGRVNPLGGKASYVYDRAGRLVSATDAKNQTTTFAYDAAGRLSTKRLADGKTVSYKYDAAGHLLEVTDSSFPVRYGYDAAGRLSKVEYPAIRRSLQYEYDPAGRLARFIDSEGRAVEYQYDAAGRLSAMRLPSGGAITFASDARDRIISVSYPNGVRGTWQYDARDLLSSVTWSDRAGKVLASWSYAYDAAGNLTRAVDAQGRVRQYRHDAGGRLAEEQGPGGTLGYSYLPGGNRSVRQGQGASTQHQYDAADRLLRAGEETFAYDANGNLVERRGPSGLTRYQYDAENRLVAVTKPDGVEVSFGYAPTGERIWRKDSSGRTWFVSDGTSLLAELGDDLRSRATYLHGPGIDFPLMMTREGREYFFHAQALGTIAALTDGAGSLAASYDADAFGDLRDHKNPLRNPFLFTAREYEPELGLYYLRARYYDPALGRFLTPDPEWGSRTGPADLNCYVYARNAPTRNVDPTGLQPITYRDLGVDSQTFGNLVSREAKLSSIHSRVFGTAGSSRAAIEYTVNTRLLDAAAQSPDTARASDLVQYVARSQYQSARGEHLMFQSDQAGARYLQALEAKRSPLQRLLAEAEESIGDPRAGAGAPAPAATGAAPGAAAPGAQAAARAAGPAGATRPVGAARAVDNPNRTWLSIRGQSSVGPEGSGAGGSLLQRVGPYAMSAAKLAFALALAYLTEEQARALGQSVRWRYEMEALREGRPFGKKDLALAGGEAAFRAAASVETMGASELAVDEIAWYKRHADELQQSLGNWRLLKQLGTERVEQFLGQVEAFVNQANALKSQHADAFQRIIDSAGKLQEAHDKLANFPNLRDSATQCTDCRTKISNLLAAEGALEQRGANISTLYETARNRSQRACQGPRDQEAHASAAAARQAERTALEVSTEMSTRVTQARALDTDVRACVQTVEANNAAIEQLHLLDMSTVRGYATTASEAAAQIRGASGSCLVLFIRADLISDMTVMSQHPRQTRIVAAAGEIEDVCQEIAADADRAAVEAGVAQSLAETTVGLINDLLVSTQNARRCPLEAVPADYVQNLETRAAQAAGLVNRARTAANTAYQCLAGARPAGGEPPALVRRSTVPKPGAAKPPQQPDARRKCMEAAAEEARRRGGCGCAVRPDEYCPMWLGYVPEDKPEDEYKVAPDAQDWCSCLKRCDNERTRARNTCLSLPGPTPSQAPPPQGGPRR